MAYSKEVMTYVNFGMEKKIRVFRLVYQWIMWRFSQEEVGREGGVQFQDALNL